jgi:hypothetical protein
MRKIRFNVRPRMIRGRWFRCSRELRKAHRDSKPYNALRVDKSRPTSCRPIEITRPASRRNIPSLE